LASWPRRALATLPTPLLRAPRLAASLDRPDLDLLVKMDSETGFALGGNKVRKLEYELAPGRLKGVTCLVTAGGPQSNHCRVTAAAAARLGLECVLVVNGPEPAQPRGNALLHRLFGAHVRVVGSRDARTAALADVAAEVAAAGGRALIVPIGASTGLGALGYAAAAVELAAQLDGLEGAPERTWLFVPSSSCGTLAGLVLGFALLGRRDVRLVGVSADAPAREIRDNALRVAAEGSELLSWRGPLAEGDLLAADDQVGEGYGRPTEASTAAIHRFAQAEGIVLDPVYTAKAAAGLVDWARAGRITRGDRVVFLHTGGHPALLA
jgi:1-aminocyclopropane-1-carboxylate deaminase/D-cysteine desulfhydrase-like pyridoxal-dependent ACC family enzyme